MLVNTNLVKYTMRDAKNLAKGACITSVRGSTGVVDCYESVLAYEVVLKARR